MLKHIFIAAVSAILGTFFVAALVTVFDKFPLPFGGYASGWGDVLESLAVILWAGLSGGFLVVSVPAGVAGALAAVLFKGSNRPRRALVLTAVLGLGSASCFVLMF